MISIGLFSKKYVIKNGPKVVILKVEGNLLHLRGVTGVLCNRLNNNNHTNSCRPIKRGLSMFGFDTPNKFVLSQEN